MTVPLTLLLMHFVGDFLLQSDWMATNKSKRNEVLTIHALVYSLCFLLWGWKFWLLTFYSHWATDWVTSRITSKLWFVPLAERPATDRYPDGEGNFRLGVGVSYYGAYTHFAYLKPTRHWFFVVIGVDQLIHAAALAATWQVLQ